MTMDESTCRNSIEPKPQSVRSQRSFLEQMQTLYQNIDTLVYAAEQACPYSKQMVESRSLGMNTFGVYKPCECPFLGKFNFCSLPSLRSTIGDHFPQHDIKEVELSN